MIVLKYGIEGQLECNAVPFNKTQIKLASEQPYRTGHFIQQTLHVHYDTASDVVCEV